MIIGADELKARADELVEGLSDTQKNIEGSEFDLRLGAAYRISGAAHIGVNHRKTPAHTEFANIKEHREGHVVTLQPNEYILVKTLERVNIPKNCYAELRPRSTLQRCGALLKTTLASPGYSGELTFGLKNMRDEPISMELGARFVRIVFHKIDGSGTEYTGVWQGGQISHPEGTRPH
tara:strand:- start:5 stop:538 length:534 start_codon:yes stop_codon:yes gene_type:complete